MYRVGLRWNWLLANPNLALLARLVITIVGRMQRGAIASACMAVVSALTALSAWIISDVINRLFVDRDQPR